jgi:c-di-GMP-binding flagellar brake protein YcgR
MDSINEWDEQLKAIEGIAGDRRTDRRYDIKLDLRWKLIRRRRLLDSGTGATVDLSSGGILFDAGRPLPVGLNVELSVAWPVLLHNTAPLQLIVSGRIVRSAGNTAAVQMVQHEFRTIAQPAEHRAATSTQPGRAPSALIAGAPSYFSFGRSQ